MIRRRQSASYSAGHDRALRSALIAAAESVEPADDGLAKIRSKIVASQARRAQWRFGVRVAGQSWWRSLLPPRGWLPAVAAAVADRFRPDPNRAGWFGWMRPAAAVGTGLFVVTAASWAVASLPAAISPSGSTAPIKPPGATKTHHPHPRHSGSQGFTTSGSGSAGPSGQTGGGKPGGGGGGAPPTATSSCSPTGSPSTTPSGTPSVSGTPTDTGSPTPTDSSTPTGTPTSADSTSPASPGSTGSPTPGAAPSSGSGTDPASPPTPGSAAMAPASAASPQATGKALINRGRSSWWGRQFRVEVVGATLVAGRAVRPTPEPLQTSLPAASPTVGAPEPTPTYARPTPPRIPCP
jgi:hypothetical protein